MKDPIEYALQFDALQEAENITGSSYKDDEETMQLGMGMFLLNNQVKAQALKNRGDSTFSCKFLDYQQILDIEGFQLVQKMDILGTEDHFFIYWQPDGILLVFDSYYADSINGGKFYYNWKPTDVKKSFREGVTSSGHFTEASIWVGDHDCREAIRHNIQKLRDNGVFLSQWVERPFLWLLHYQDTKTEGYDYKTINKNRITLLPEHVRKAITPQ